jgi:hypothetical protein
MQWIGSQFPEALQGIVCFMMQESLQKANQKNLYYAVTDLELAQCLIPLPVIKE